MSTLRSEHPTSWFFSCHHLTPPNTSLFVSLSGFHFYLFIVYVFLAMLQGMWDLSCLTKDQTHTPSHWKLRVLTTGLPGKSPVIAILNGVVEVSTVGKKHRVEIWRTMSWPHLGGHQEE